MKVKILTRVGASLTMFALLILGAGNAFAFTDGQINGGDIYRTEDITQNSSFSDTTTAKACDVLQYRVRLYNPGSATVNSVNVQADVSNESTDSNKSTIQITSSDADPSSVYAFTTVNFASAQTESYISGSTQLLDQNDNLIKALPDGITIGGTGVNAGDVGPSVTEYVQFQEKVNCSTPTPPAPTPSYTCDELSISPQDNRTVEVSKFTTTAQNGASFTNASINWGDHSASTTTANLIGQTHQFAQSGTYTITATANFNVNGQTESATSESCAKQVTFNSTTPPTVTPPTTTTPTPPSQLVNTGPGSVIGIFAAVSAIAAVGYRRFLGRKITN